MGIVALAAMTLCSCEDLLDTKNYTQSNTQNFPTSMDDVEMLVTSMYANLNLQAAKPESSYLLTNLYASDDMFAGSQDAELDHLMYKSDSQFDFCWDIHYKGIYAANTCLEGLDLMEAADNVPDAGLFSQRKGEACFMRAFQYYELAELFGGVPLILSTTQETNTPRATADEVWAQIATDLQQAISLMSDKKYHEIESGHATKWAAQALMARCFLFYTGYYQKEAMPTADGGSITKQQVVTWLEDCIANSGHQLVGDFRNLWAYTNEYTVDDYAYTAGVTGVDGQPLRWAGNGNAEAVFAVKFGNFAGYSYENQGGYCNLYLSFFGIMSKSDNGAAFPFGNTNSFGTVPTSLWDSWEAAEPDDIRRRASVIVDEDEFDMANYESGEVRQQWEETGLWNKKLQPILSKQAYDKMGSWGNSLFWIAHPEFAGMNDPYIQPRWAAMFEDLYIIRFADVLLMHSELTGNADNMNRVRARAGLPAIGYSLEALQQERRHELAFEGQRFQDIRRWHIAETELNKQNNTTLKNLGVSTVMRDGKYAARYQATGGFWPIPPAQIQLSDGVLTQNPGWDTPDARYTTWNFD